MFSQSTPPHGFQIFRYEHFSFLITSLSSVGARFRPGVIEGPQKMVFSALALISAILSEIYLMKMTETSGIKPPRTPNYNIENY